MAMKVLTSEGFPRLVAQIRALIGAAKSDTQGWVQETAKAASAKVADAIGTESVGSKTTPIHLVAGTPTACDPYPVAPDLGQYATKAYVGERIDESVGEAMGGSY